MGYIKWIILMAISFLIGFLLVSYLTVHPLKMSRYLFLTSLFLFILLVVLSKAFLGRKLIVAIPLCLVFFLVGYYFETHRFLSRDDPRPVPEIMRTKGDLGKGHTAVVYFTHGEPETYDPIGWINQFREFDEQKIKFIPFPIRPYFVYMLRNKYLQVGKSDHRSMHKKMIRSLEKMFRDEGDIDTKFYLSFLDDNPRPDSCDRTYRGGPPSRTLRPWRTADRCSSNWIFTCCDDGQCGWSLGQCQEVYRGRSFRW